MHEFYFVTLSRDVHLKEKTEFLNTMHELTTILTLLYFLLFFIVWFNVEYG